MAQLTKQALTVENNQSFPNNNAGAITPAILREFNQDIIDSTVNQTVYTADSASFDSRINAITGSGGSVSTGSLLTTASFDNNSRNLTFTKGDSTQFSVNIPDVSGSILPSGVVSGSSQINYPQISNIPSGIVSGSSQILGGSGILSSSNQTFATYTGSVDNSISALNTFSSSQLVKDSTLGLYTASNDTKWNTLGSISGSFVLESETGSFITNSQTSSMSVNFAVTSSKAQDLYVNAKNTTSLVISKGAVVRITGASGDNPEVGLADWTNDNFSANTIGMATADIPVNGFADIVVQGRLIGLNTAGFTAGQNIFLGASGSFVASVPTPYHEVRLGQVLRANTNNGSIYLSIDNGYELTELHDVSISTASLANNDLLAYDSASHQWTNKSILGLGIPKLGSDNTFTGNNSFQSISAVSASFQYVQSVTGSAVIIGESFVVVNNDTPTAPYGGLSVYDSGSALPTTSSLVWDGNTNDWKYSYDVGAGHDAAVMLFGPDANGLANTPYPSNNKLQKGNGGHHLLDSSIYDDGTTVSVGANLAVTGSITTNGNPVLVNNDLAPLNSFTSSQLVVNTNLNASTASQQISIDNLNLFTASYVPTDLGPLNAFTSSQIVVNTNLNLYTASNDTKWNTLGTQSGSWDNTQLNSFTASQETTNTQLLTASSSFAEKFATIGTQSGSWGGGTSGVTSIIAGSGISVDQSTGDVTITATGGGGGAGFPYTGSAAITGSLTVTGSMSGYVNALTITDQTASLNFNDGNFFTLQLVSGSITHLTATNIKPGQAINLLVKMDSVAGITASSGSLSFSPTFKFAGGFDYTPTKITGSQDLVSFVTFDTTQVLAAQVKNLS
jgi:hypothetical protein